MMFRIIASRDSTVTAFGAPFVHSNVVCHGRSEEQEMEHIVTRIGDLRQQHGWFSGIVDPKTARY